MPNWCQNVATFKHNDLAMMVKLVDAIDSKDVFKSFFPTPPELDRSPAHSWGGSEEQIADQNAIRNENIEKYGYENGNAWHLYQDGDLWAYCPELMSNEEYKDFFGEEKED